MRKVSGSHCSSQFPVRGHGNQACFLFVKLLAQDCVEQQNSITASFSHHCAPCSNSHTFRSCTLGGIPPVLGWIVQPWALTRYPYVDVHHEGRGETRGRCASQGSVRMLRSCLVVCQKAWMTMGPLSVMDGRQLALSLPGLASPKGGTEIDRAVMGRQLWAPILGSPFQSVVKTADQVGFVHGKLIPFIFLKLHYLFVYMCVCTCHGVHMEVR